MSYKHQLQRRRQHYLVMKFVSAAKPVQQQKVCRAHGNVRLKHGTTDAPRDQVQAVAFTATLHQHLDTQPQQFRIFARRYVRQRCDPTTYNGSISISRCTACCNPFIRCFWNDLYCVGWGVKLYSLFAPDKVATNVLGKGLSLHTVKNTRVSPTKLHTYSIKLHLRHKQANLQIDASVCFLVCLSVHCVCQRHLSYAWTKRDAS